MAKGSNASLWPWLGLAAILFVADQFTKVLILGYYQLGDSTTITSFFNIVRVHNTGAAFSFLAGAGGWQRWFFTAVGVGAGTEERVALLVKATCGHTHVALGAVGTWRMEYTLRPCWGMQSTQGMLEAPRRSSSLQDGQARGGRAVAAQKGGAKRCGRGRQGGATNGVPRLGRSS